MIRPLRDTVSNQEERYPKPLSPFHPLYLTLDLGLPTLGAARKFPLSARESGYRVAVEIIRSNGRFVGLDRRKGLRAFPIRPLSCRSY